MCAAARRSGRAHRAGCDALRAVCPASVRRSDQHRARHVLGQRPRVGYGQHGDAHGMEGAGFVDTAHVSPRSFAFNESKSAQAFAFSDGCLSRKAGWNIGSAGRPSTSSHDPRNRVMPRLPRRPKHAQFPMRTSTSGSASSTCRRTKGLQHRDLLGRRIAVLRRAPGQHVGDVDRRFRILRGPRQADGTQHRVQKLSGAADEGLALDILVAARGLSHDHHPGRRIAVGKDEVARAMAQVAGLEPRERVAEFLQGPRRCGKRLRMTDRGGGGGGLVRRSGHWRSALRCLDRLGESRRRPTGRLDRLEAVHRRVEDGLVRTQFHLARRDAPARPATLSSSWSKARAWAGRGKGKSVAAQAACCGRGPLPISRRGGTRRRHELPAAASTGDRAPASRGHPGHPRSGRSLRRCRAWSGSARPSARGSHPDQHVLRGLDPDTGEFRDRGHAAGCGRDEHVDAGEFPQEGRDADRHGR